MAEPVDDSSTDTSNPTPRLPAPHPVGYRVAMRLGEAFTFAKFRNLWTAAFTSAVGTWMQRFAQQWLVFTLTGSAFYLGLDTFLGALPLLLFTLIGGVIADRYDRSLSVTIFRGRP